MSGVLCDHAMSGVLHQLFSVRCAVLSVVLCHLCRVRCVVSVVQYQVCCVSCTLSGVLCQLCSVRCVV